MPSLLMQVVEQMLSWTLNDEPIPDDEVCSSPFAGSASNPLGNNILFFRVQKRRQNNVFQYHFSEAI